VELRQANYEVARARYEEARPIYAAIGARLGEAAIPFCVAQCLWAEGDLAGAENQMAAAAMLYERVLPGHPFTKYAHEQLTALRAELSASA
jgi:hypothetical protein